jgi:hypothetical protein
VPLDAVAAKQLDGRIASMVDAIGDRLTLLDGYLRQAEQGQIHLALGYPSWPAYIEDRMRGRWALKGSERQRAAQMLASHGASTRAIASITGASKSTIARDIADTSVPFGTDGAATELDESPGTAALDASVPNGTELPDAVINTRTGRPQRRRKPRPKKEPVTKGSTGEPPAESGKVGAGNIAATVAELRASGRKVQIPTAFRLASKELAIVTARLRLIADDPRMAKAVARFTEQDRDVLDDAITILGEVRHALGPAEEATA